MTTHFGSTATAFFARTFYGFLIGDNVLRKCPPIGPEEPSVMLASLNFSMTDGRGGMCPMCTDEDPCFLCSDELNWNLGVHQHSSPTTDSQLRPIPPFDGLRTWDIPEPAPPSSEPAHPTFWYKTGGEVYGSGIIAAPDSEIEAAIEAFDTSDVDELVAYYDKNDEDKLQAEKGLLDEDKEDIIVDAYLGSEADSGSSRDGPYD